MKTQFGAVVALTVAGLALSAVTVSAATLSNRDTKAYELRVIEGDQEQIITVEAEQQVELPCATACILSLNMEDADAFDIAAADQLAIEEGQLFVEEAAPDKAEGDGEAKTQ